MLRKRIMRLKKLSNLLIKVIVKIQIYIFILELNIDENIFSFKKNKMNNKK